MKTTSFAMVFENLEREFLVLIVKRKRLFFDFGKRKKERILGF
jgi:hypothetical protein